MVKFQQYSIVNIKNTIGAWIILSNAIKIANDGCFKILEDEYIIHSLTKNHPAKIQTVLASELEFQV
jgi:hypothetical protein